MVFLAVMTRCRETGRASLYRIRRAIDSTSREGRVENAFLEDFGDLGMKTKYEIRVDKIELRTAGAEAAETGLLGWLSFRLNRALAINGVALRRTRGGRYALSFPAKHDAFGQQHFIVRPLDDSARETIELQIFRALGLVA